MNIIVVFAATPSLQQHDFGAASPSSLHKTRMILILVSWVSTTSVQPLTGKLAPPSAQKHSAQHGKLNDEPPVTRWPQQMLGRENAYSDTRMPSSKIPRCCFLECTHRCSAQMSCRPCSRGSCPVRTAARCPSPGRRRTNCQCSAEANGCSAPGLHRECLAAGSGVTRSSTLNTPTAPSIVISASASQYLRGTLLQAGACRLLVWQCRFDRRALFGEAR